MLSVLGILLQNQPPWERAAPDNAAQQLVADIREKKFGDIHSLIIIKDGKLAVEEYFGTSRAETLQDLQSATKTVASLLIGIAANQGKLKLSDTVQSSISTDYLWDDDKRRQQATIGDILAMKHGMDWHEWGAASAQKDNYIQANSTDWIQYLLNKPMATTPGTQFNYSTGASVFLSAAIHKSCQMSTKEFSRKFLFEPIGAKSPSWWITDKKGIEHTGGGLKMNSIDFARVGFLLLKDGQWFGKQIIAKDYIRRMFEPTTKAALTVTMNGTKQDLDYGLHAWTMKVKGQTVRAAMGVGGQYIFAIPIKDLLIVTSAWNKSEPAQSQPLGWIDRLLP